MNAARPRLAAALVAPAPELAATWSEHLGNRILKSWRPGEFDAERLLLVPDPSNPRTFLKRCIRNGCLLLIEGGNYCAPCRKEWAMAKAEGVTREAWSAVPRRRLEPTLGCLVLGCGRQHSSNRLCKNHSFLYRKHKRKSHLSSYTQEDWIQERNPNPLPPGDRCVLPTCSSDRTQLNGLCDNHQSGYRRWRTSQNVADDSESLACWVERVFEPLMDPKSMTPFAAAYATPFGLLKGAFALGIPVRSTATRLEGPRPPVRG